MTNIDDETRVMLILKYGLVMKIAENGTVLVLKHDLPDDFFYKMFKSRIPYTDFALPQERNFDHEADFYDKLIEYDRKYNQ